MFMLIDVFFGISLGKLSLFNDLLNVVILF